MCAVLQSGVPDESDDLQESCVALTATDQPMATRHAGPSQDEGWLEKGGSIVHAYVLCCHQARSEGGPDASDAKPDDTIVRLIPNFAQD